MLFHSRHKREIGATSAFCCLTSLVSKLSNNSVPALNNYERVREMHVKQSLRSTQSPALMPRCFPPRIEVEWKLSGEEFRVRLTIPVGVTAQLRVPPDYSLVQRIADFDGKATTEPAGSTDRRHVKAGAGAGKSAIAEQLSSPAMDGDWVLVDAETCTEDQQHSSGNEDPLITDAYIMAGPGEQQCFCLTR